MFYEKFEKMQNFFLFFEMFAVLKFLKTCFIELKFRVVYPFCPLYFYVPAMNYLNEKYFHWHY